MKYSAPTKLGPQTEANSQSVTIAGDQIVPVDEKNPQVVEVLRLMLIELRVMNSLLTDGLLPGKMSQSIDAMRNDEDFSLDLNG